MMTPEERSALKQLRGSQAQHRARIEQLLAKVRPCPERLESVGDKLMEGQEPDSDMRLAGTACLIVWMLLEHEYHASAIDTVLAARGLTQEAEPRDDDWKRLSDIWPDLRGKERRQIVELAKSMRPA